MALNLEIEFPLEKFHIGILKLNSKVRYDHVYEELSSYQRTVGDINVNVISRKHHYSFLFDQNITLLSKSLNLLNLEARMGPGFSIYNVGKSYIAKDAVGNPFKRSLFYNSYDFVLVLRFKFVQISGRFHYMPNGIPHWQSTMDQNLNFMGISYSIKIPAAVIKGIFK